MSQNQGFTEPELIDTIYKLINFKVDKEALQRPNRTVVCEIYSRFLDQFDPNWRECKEPESSQFTQLLEWMKLILGRYGPNIDQFDWNDLSAPTRRRTHVFLEALILFKVDLDDRRRNKEYKMAAMAEEKDQLDLMDQKLAKLKLERDNLAHKIGDAPEYREIEEPAKLTLKEHQKRCEDHDELAREAKNKIADIKESLNILEEEEKKLKLRELEKQKHLKVAEMMASKAKYQVELDTLKLQKAVVQKDSQINSQKVRDKARNHKQIIGDRLIAKREKYDELKQKILEIPNRRKDREEKVEAGINRMTREMEPKRNLIEEAKRKSEQGRIISANNQAKINTLLYGLAKTENIGTNVNDATYIKSPANN